MCWLSPFTERIHYKCIIHYQCHNPPPNAPVSCRIPPVLSPIIKHHQPLYSLSYLILGLSLCHLPSTVATGILLAVPQISNRTTWFTYPDVCRYIIFFLSVILLNLIPQSPFSVTGLKMAQRTFPSNFLHSIWIKSFSDSFPSRGMIKFYISLFCFLQIISEI